MTAIAPVTAEPPQLPRPSAGQAPSRPLPAGPATASAPFDGIKLTLSGARVDRDTVTGTQAASRAAVPSPDVAFGAQEDLRRLGAVVATLQDNAKNVSEMRRQIVDAALAAQAAHRSRMMMLQEPATAMAAQANPSPGTVLGLLQTA